MNNKDREHHKIFVKILISYRFGTDFVKLKIRKSIFR